MEHNNILICFISMLIFGGCYPPIGPDNPISLPQSFTSWFYDEPNQTTHITLISGNKLIINGRFEIQTTLWGNNSLMWASGNKFMVLDSDQSSLWTLYQNKRNHNWLRPCGPSISANGKYCFLWLNISKQLMAIEIATGKQQWLTKLPRRIENLENFSKTLDPKPVWRSQGVVHDPKNNRLIFLIQEQVNYRTNFWQRRPNRGGYQIISLNLDTNKSTPLSGPDMIKGRAYSWDVSLQRREMYISVTREGERFLEIWNLDDRQLRKIVPQSKEGIRRLCLSPDEQTLLVENLKSGDLYGGLSFNLIDLKTFKTVPGPSHGQSASWSPDGCLISYLENGRLWLYDTQKHTSDLVLHRENPYVSLAYGGQEPPRWSPDGNMLAVNIGGDYTVDRLFESPTVIIDFTNSIATVLPYAEEICWIPYPHPFRDK